jgi:hypothetical protein
VKYTEGLQQSETRVSVGVAGAGDGAVPVGAVAVWLEHAATVAASNTIAVRIGQIVTGQTFVRK